MATPHLYNEHVYSILQTGIQIEKNMHTAYQLIGDDHKAHDSFIKILHGERALSFIRANRLRNDPLYKSP